MNIKNKSKIIHKLFSKNKGQSITATIIGILILGGIGTALLNTTSAMKSLTEYDSQDNISKDVSGIISNLASEIKNHSYKTLVPDYNNSSKNIVIINGNGSINKYIAKLETETMIPCKQKTGICDFTRVKINVYDANNPSELLASEEVNRAFTHYAKKEEVQYTGYVVTLPLNSDVVGIQYYLWGAGGGRGGYDLSDGAGSHQASGGAAGAVIGEIDDITVSKQDNLYMLIGSHGWRGNNDGEAGCRLYTRSPIYGWGGVGGATGCGGGGSGAGGSGGGLTMLSLNDTLIAIAGGGGGAGGGSKGRPVWTAGSSCDTVRTSSTDELGNIYEKYQGETGKGAPSDGGGGGAGGAGYPAGAGGSYGADDGRTATSGCYGHSWSSNSADLIFNPNGTTPGAANNPFRGHAGEGETSDGTAKIFLIKESEATI